MNRTRIAVIALATAGAVATAVAPSAGAATDDQRTSQHTLVLTLRYADASNHFVGSDADQPQPGDRFIDSGPVRAQGQVVGQATNVCTVVGGTSPTTTVTQCIATFTLANGELVTMGADDASTEATDAVAGGTGSYTDARGTARTVSGPDTATFTIRYSTDH
jgi:hypothetical protein